MLTYKKILQQQQEPREFTQFLAKYGKTFFNFHYILVKQQNKIYLNGCVLEEKEFGEQLLKYLLTQSNEVIFQKKNGEIDCKQEYQYSYEIEGGIDYLVQYNYPVCLIYRCLNKQNITLTFKNLYDDLFQYQNSDVILFLLKCKFQILHLLKKENWKFILDDVLEFIKEKQLMRGDQQIHIFLNSVIEQMYGYQQIQQYTAYNRFNEIIVYDSSMWKYEHIFGDIFLIGLYILSDYNQLKKIMDYVLKERQISNELRDIYRKSASEDGHPGIFDKILEEDNGLIYEVGKIPKNVSIFSNEDQ